MCSTRWLYNARQFSCQAFALRNIDPREFNLVTQRRRRSHGNRDRLQRTARHAVSGSPHSSRRRLNVGDSG